MPSLNIFSINATKFTSPEVSVMTRHGDHGVFDEADRTSECQGDYAGMPRRTHKTHSTVYCSVMNPRNNFSLSGPYVLQKNVVKFGTLSYFFLPLLIFVVVLLKKLLHLQCKECTLLYYFIPSYPSIYTHKNTIRVHAFVLCCWRLGFLSCLLA